jgi:hypothetical protein
MVWKQKTPKGCFLVMPIVYVTKNVGLRPFLDVDFVQKKHKVLSSFTNTEISLNLHYDQLQTLY